MRAEDLFSTSDDGSLEEFRADVLDDIMARRVEAGSDLEIADVLVQLVHEEFRRCATSADMRIAREEDIECLLRASRTACRRVGVEMPDLPFRNFSTFRGYWKREGMSGPGSWGERTGYLHQLFYPTEQALDRRRQRDLDDGLAAAISPRGETGWREVDTEIVELRRRFEVAQTPQDYSAVGTACVRALEALGVAAFDPAKHLESGEAVPPRDKSKARLRAVIMRSLPGGDAEEMRKLLYAAIEVAHQVKHRQTPTRRDAGMAADATILAVNLVRRLLSAP